MDKWDENGMNLLSVVFWGLKWGYEGRWKDSCKCCKLKLGIARHLKLGVMRAAVHLRKIYARHKKENGHDESGRVGVGVSWKQETHVQMNQIILTHVILLVGLLVDLT